MRTGTRLGAKGAAALMLFAGMTLAVSVAVAANVTGTNRGERLIGTDGSDYIKARGGNDKVRALNGDDIVSAGRGRDRVAAGGGDDKVSGGRGVEADRLFGASGDDKLRGNAGDDILNGGSGRDALFGNAGNDVIEGWLGKDFIGGNAGNDTLSGGDQHADQVFGGPGNDSIKGGGGSDRLHGGDGNDRVQGDNLNDLDVGRAAATTCRSAARAPTRSTQTSAWTRPSAASGNDRLWALATADVPLPGVDTLHGEDGNDTFHTRDKEPDRDRLRPGQGQRAARLRRRDRRCDAGRTRTGSCETVNRAAPKREGGPSENKRESPEDDHEEG